MPKRPTSWASDSVNPSRAHFDASWAAMSGNARGVVLQELADPDGVDLHATTTRAVAALNAATARTEPRVPPSRSTVPNMSRWRDRKRPRETMWVVDVALAVGSAAVGIGYLGRGAEVFGWGWLVLAVGWVARAVVDRRRRRAHPATTAGAHPSEARGASGGDPSR